MLAQVSSIPFSAPLLVIGAAVAFYLAARTADEALSRTRPASPFWHAAAHWMPIAIVALLATLMDQPAVAVGVIFSTSVAALSLHVGIVTLHAEGEREAPPAARAWAFLLPAALLALVAGFRGQLTLVHAAMFAAQGVVIAMVWRDAARRAAAAGEAARPEPVAPLQVAECLVAAAVAALGAWAAVLGAVRMAEETRIMTTGLVAATTISPTLVLPLIGSGSRLVRRGDPHTATAAAVVIVLLNLCALLPLTILAWEARPHVVKGVSALVLPLPEAVAVADASPATQPTTAEASVDEDAEESERQPMTFPIAVWRVDAVVLVILGLLLLPVALRHWSLGRREGAALVVGYAIYLLLTTALGRRW